MRKSSATWTTAVSLTGGGSLGSVASAQADTPFTALGAPITAQPFWATSSPLVTSPRSRFSSATFTTTTSGGSNCLGSTRRTWIGAASSEPSSDRAPTAPASAVDTSAGSIMAAEPDWTDSAYFLAEA